MANSSSLEVCQFLCGEDIGSGGAVLALGAFDAFHPGQIRIIEEARRQARRLAAPLAVLSVEPHPRRLQQPPTGPFSLLTRDQQVRALRSLMVDRLYILRFDAAVSRMTHDEVSARIFRDTLHVRHVVAPIGFAYGKGRQGGRAELVAQGLRYGFGVSFTEPQLASNGQICSSRAVRDLLSKGRAGEAVELFGRPFAIEGPVQHGAKLARSIGFPTANVPLGDYIRPAAGIYASVTVLPDGRRLPSLSYIGRRPTVDGGDERLEVFLYDFDEDLYGEQIETALTHFIRPDVKFDSLEAMQEQMEDDRAKGRIISFSAIESAIFLR
jgi:riboflavin kinase/FMN adenylyltransferase